MEISTPLLRANRTFFNDPAEKIIPLLLPLNGGNTNKLFNPKKMLFEEKFYIKENLRLEIISI